MGRKSVATFEISGEDIPYGIQQFIKTYRDMNPHLLSREEEIQYAKLRKEEDLQGKGTHNARNYLALNNLRLAMFLASKYHDRHPSWDMEDMFQDAFLGLLRAAEKYDPDKETRFSTYAFFWINQQLHLRSPKENSQFSISQSQEYAFQKVDRISNDYYEKTGHYPGAQELRELGVSAQAVSSYFNLRSMKAPTVPLDGLAFEDDGEDGKNYGDLIGLTYDDRMPEDDERGEKIEKAVSKILSEEFSDEERNIIEKVYGLGGEWKRTPSQIAHEIPGKSGITGKQISEKHDEILNRMAENRKMQELTKFFEG